MARFRDLRTGDVIPIEGHARVKHHRQMRTRFEELHDTPPDADTVSVPDGLSVAATVEWAGDNPARRTAALAYEKANKNRKTLVAALSD